MKLLLTLAIGLAGSTVFGQAFTSTYDFSLVTVSSGVTDPTVPPTATGVTFGSFSAFGTPPNPNASVRFSFTNNVVGGINSDNNFADFTGSLNPAKYYEVTVAPQVGYTLNVDTIAFTIQRSSTGIRSYAVRSSVDSFAANLPASISPASVNLGVGPGDEFRWLLDANTGALNGSLVTLGAPFDVLAAPVTYRFYGWNAEANGGTFSIDNVAFAGSASAVPEPTSLCLIMVGAGVFALRRRTA